MNMTTSVANQRTSRLFRYAAMTCAAVGVVSASFLHASPPSTTGDPTAINADGRVRINAITTPGDEGGVTPSLYKITHSGSYYLDGNITGVPGRSGIEIAASGVTIDLMGFELAGVPGSGEGIECHSGNGVRGIEIRNGTIRSWGEDGINVSSTPASNCLIENIRTFNNNRRGIAAGQAAIIRNCIANNNLGAGIVTAAGSLVVQCVAYQNVLDGITANSNSSIIDCVVSENQGNAIVVHGTSLVRGNNCIGQWEGSRKGGGIRVDGANNRIEGNTCSWLLRGIEVVTPGNFIVNNTCSRNDVNWILNKGNSWGTIYNMAGVNQAEDFKGDSAPGTLPKDADVHANWTY